jgi:hypothetical protein
VSAGDWIYIGQSINPIAGLLVSVPWAILKMHYPLWIVLLSAPPLAYVQVVVADLLGSQLQRLRYVQKLLEKRSPRVDKLLKSGGAFLPVMLATPFVGGWVVMLVMRYAKVPQKRVVAPILLSLVLLTVVLSVLCIAVPNLFRS